MKKLFLCIILCCCTLLADALTLKGYVKTEEGALLSHVSVYLPNLKIGAITDMDGNYRLTGVTAGKHTVVVSYVGYATQTLEVNIKEDSTCNFTLHEQAITLDEVFVTPTGESLERFILSQTVKHSRKLAKVVDHFELHKDFVVEERGQDIKFLFDGMMGVINPILGLMGYRTIFHFLLDNPSFRIETAFDDVCNKGKMKMQSLTYGNCTPQLTKEQQKSFRKVLEEASGGDEYDKTYEHMADLKKDIEKQAKKDPEGAQKALTYTGAYEDNGRTIHIISTPRRDYHIIDGIWQVRRVVIYKKGSKQQSGIVEFAELGKNVFMPISQFVEFNFEFDKLLKSSLEDLKKADTSKMKEKERQKTEEKIAKIEQLMTSGGNSCKVSSGFSYKNFQLKK